MIKLCGKSMALLLMLISQYVSKGEIFPKDFNFFSMSQKGNKKSD